jgi:peptidoglycan/xylan/chitin deacetylase (PgdA/CDA1 family)
MRTDTLYGDPFEMVYRHDDWPQGMDVPTMQTIHDEFVRRQKKQTLVVDCSYLDHQAEVIDFMKSQPLVDFQLHCLKHSNYGLMKDREIEENLGEAIKKFERYLGMRPTIWYPPWNGWVDGRGFAEVPRLRDIAWKFGLHLDAKSIDIGHYVLHPERYKHIKTVYFHGWMLKERELLPRLLDL